jgi:hypothetical protein
LLNPIVVVTPATSAQFAYQEPSGTAAVLINSGDTTIPLNTAVYSALWASLGASTVTVTEGSYFVQGSLYLVDLGGTGIGGCQLCLRNGASDMNWQDAVINNVDDTAQVSVSSPLNVSTGSTAVLSLQIRLGVGSAGYYGVDTTSSRTERPASLSIIKFS